MHASRTIGISRFAHVSLLLATAMLMASAVMAQDRRGRDDQPAPPRERSDDQPRAADEPRTRQAPAEQERPRRRDAGDRDQPREGTPDGQPRLQLAPEPTVRPGEPRIAPNRWYLGIYAYDTEQGVMVTDVVPGSPAARAGLEPRDLIVTVDGFQVGYVDDRYYPLGQELQQRADRIGRVTLLVQNRRNDRLVNLNVRLERRGSYFTRPRQR